MIRLIIYECKENDNTIEVKVDEETGILDELEVGTHWDPESGWSIIGLKDLTECLAIAGYKLVKEDSDV